VKPERARAARGLGPGAPLEPRAREFAAKYAGGMQRATARRRLDALPPPEAPPAHVAPATGAAPPLPRYEPTPATAEHTVPPAPSGTFTRAPVEPPPPASMRAPWISGRLGFGVGFGGEGYAGNYFAELDTWPLTALGLGGEVECAGSTDISIGAPPDTNNFTALRARLSLRFRVGPRAFLTAAVGVGGAWVDFNKPVGGVDRCSGAADIDACVAGNEARGISEATYSTSTSSSAELSASLELGAHVELRQVEVSGLVRLTVTGPVTLVTVGPAIGFGL